MNIPAIGQFNKVVKWERVVKSPDNTSGQNEQYTDWFVGRMAMKEMNQGRKINFGYDEMSTVYEGFIQWRHAIEIDITKDVRTVFQNRFFGIKTYRLVDDVRRMYYVVMINVT